MVRKLHTRRASQMSRKSRDQGDLAPQRLRRVIRGQRGQHGLGLQREAAVGVVADRLPARRQRAGGPADLAVALRVEVEVALDEAR